MHIGYGMFQYFNVHKICHSISYVVSYIGYGILKLLIRMQYTI